MLANEKQLADIKWAIDSLRVKQDTYTLYRDYYQGNHRLMIDQERLRTAFNALFKDFRLNLCTAVVDALVDRLQIQSFTAEGSGGEEQNASDIWKRNRMMRRSGQVHLEAVSTGDSYVLVWPVENKAIFYPQKSHEIVVDYDPESPGVILKAAKAWKEGKRFRLNLYYPDSTEKYATKEKSDTTTAITKPQDFERFDVPGELWPLPNQYDMVPVFHFANNADLGEYGVSELTDGIPIQDMMNYLVFNLLVGVEFQAFPQRYALNIDVPRDADGNPVSPFKAGPDKVWAIEGENASMGQFTPADLDKIVNVKTETSLTMAQVTGTPPHYFMLSNNFVSGESQKTAEQKLDSKVNDRTISFGDTWAAAMALALRMERGMSIDGLELDTNWKDTKPRNETESWAIAKVKDELGVSRRQILREKGYTDDQIDEFENEKKSEGGQDASAIVPAGSLDRTRQLIQGAIGDRASENATTPAEPAA